MANILYKLRLNAFSELFDISDGSDNSENDPYLIKYIRFIYKNIKSIIWFTIKKINKITFFIKTMFFRINF